MPDKDQQKTWDTLTSKIRIDHFKEQLNVSIPGPKFVFFLLLRDNDAPEIIRHAIIEDTDLIRLNDEYYYVKMSNPKLPTLKRK